jgi:hypothetical protein
MSALRPFIPQSQTCLAAPRTTQKATKRHSPVAQTRFRKLVVRRSAHLAKSLRVEAFGSAPELLQKVPSCLVLDIRLPGMSGPRAEGQSALFPKQAVRQIYFNQMPLHCLGESWRRDQQMRVLAGILQATNFDRLGRISGQDFSSCRQSMGARAHSAKKASDFARSRSPFCKLHKSI